MWNLFGTKNDISASDVMKKMKNGWRPYIIDVRSRGEAKQSGVVKGTKLVHHHGKIAQKRKEIPKNKDVLLVCRSGSRSGVALKKLKTAGFESTNLYNLKGGVIAWARNGGVLKRL